MRMGQIGPGAAELVGGGRHLRKLSLFNSQLGDEGAKRIAAILSSETLTGLLELELSGCGIGTEGMTVLFEALQTSVAPALEVGHCHMHAWLTGARHGHGQCCMMLMLAAAA